MKFTEEAIKQLSYDDFQQRYWFEYKQGKTRIADYHNAWGNPTT